METVSVDVGFRVRCPKCEVEVHETETFDLVAGQLPPDLSSHRAYARKQLSASDTIEVLQVDSEAVALPDTIGAILRAGGMENYLAEKFTGAGS